MKSADRGAQEAQHGVLADFTLPFDDLIRQPVDQSKQFRVLCFGHLELRERAFNMIHRDLPVAQR